MTAAFHRRKASFPMNSCQILVWNVRGLNNRACCAAVRSIVIQERVSILCIQETKVVKFSISMISDTLGPDFDYIYLSSVGAAGDVLVSWRRDQWHGLHTSVASIFHHGFLITG